MTITEIKSLVQLILMIITQGKDIVEAIGDIVEEVKTWFHKDPVPENEVKAMKEIQARIAPLVSATKLEGQASGKEVRKVADVFWNLDPSTVKKTIRVMGKTAGRKAA